MNTIARVTLLLGALGLLASTAPAQTFGRNAVQYKTFHFKILKTQHFDVYFYDEEADAAAQAARMAERWYTRISTVLRHQLSGRQPLILYADHPRTTRPISPRWKGVKVSPRASSGVSSCH